MNERFIEIKNITKEKVKKALARVLGTPPSYEEAVGGFQHKKDCSMAAPLNKLEKDYVESIVIDSFLPTFFLEGRVTYIECGECLVKQEYRGS